MITVDIQNGQPVKERRSTLKKHQMMKHSQRFRNTIRNSHVFTCIITIKLVYLHNTKDNQ